MTPRHSRFLSPLRSSRFAVKLVGLLGLLALPLARSATLYWDGNGTTAGAGTTPSGTWASSMIWGSNAAGTTATSNPTTSNLKDDIFFAAGTDATGAYTVTISNTQNARLLTIEEGTPTFTGGTLNLASSSGGITTLAGAATVSSNLTISGSQTLNTAAGTTIALDTGVFTRNPGASLNIQGAGTVTSTMTNLSTVSPTGIIGTWATFGTGATTRYAAFTGSTITALTGTAAANAAALADTTGTANYDLAATSGTLPASVSANTIRYTGGTATLAPGATLFSVNGIMNAGTGALTIDAANPLTIGADRELVLNSANNSITVSSIIQDNSGGASAVTKIGSGSLTLSGANTYNGVTYISQGVVTISNPNALGSTVGHTVINTNGSTTTGGMLYLSGGISVAENITITGPGDGIANSYNATIASTSGINTITGVITLSGSNTYRLGASSGTVLNVGLIQRTGTDSASIVLSASGTGVVNITQPIKNNNGGLTVHAGGIAVLSASNNEIGNTNVQNNSTLRLAANNALPSIRDVQVGNSSGNTSTGSGNDVGTLILEGTSQTINALNAYANAGATPNNTTTTDRRKITSNSASNSSLTVGANNGSGNFDGVIEDGTAGGIMSFTKIGTGTQTFSGTVANTYTGVTTVNGGMLALAKTAGVNAISGNVVIGDGTGGDIVRLNNSHQIADTSIISFNGSGSTTGILRLNNQSETVGGLSSAAGSGIVENESGSAGTGTLAVNVAASTTQSYGGVIRNGDGSGTDGTLAFEKNGAGTQVLTGASTYTGGTTVNNGTLLANNASGSATGSGPVMIVTTASLGGTGSIGLGAASRATVMGTLSPGSGVGSVESLEFTLANAMGAGTSGVTFDSSTLAFDLGAGGSSITAVGISDSLLVNGTVNEAGDLAFVGTSTFDFGGTGSNGWYKLFDTAAGSLFDWSGLTVDANRQITGGLAFANLGNGLTGTLYLGDGGANGDFGDVYLHVTPEPGRALLLVGGLLSLAFRRRRK